MQKILKLLDRFFPRYAYFPVILTVVINGLVYYGCYLLTAHRTSFYDLSIP